MSIPDSLVKPITLSLAFLLATIFPAHADDPPAARQVTLFGVVASSLDKSIDPKLSKVIPQLRKLVPDHGFRLIDVQSKRLAEGETVSCELDGGYTAAAALIRSADDNGKVQLRCVIKFLQAKRLETIVSTPPNQLFFCDKALNNGTRLLIGIGAR
jgi:hypothetical protein